MTTKISEYEIVVGDGDVELARNVNRLIKDGWRPIGGPTVYQSDKGPVLIQAVVKYSR